MLSLQYRSVAKAAPWVFGALLCAVVFWGSTGLDRYYDDWSFTAAAALALEENRVGAFLVEPVGLHWSPFWNLFSLTNFLLVGWDDDRFIRAVTLLSHAAGLFWFFRVGRALGLAQPAVLVGMAVLALHHVRAAALYSFDTYAQVFVDLGSWFAGGLALMAIRGGSGLLDWRLPLAAAIPLLLLPMKEQALSGCAAVVALIGVASLNASAPERRRGLILVASLTLGSLAFAVARNEAGVPLSGEEVYRLCPTCVPQNLVTIAGSLAIPVRTLTVVDAWLGGNIALLALAAVTTAVLVLLLLPAIRQRHGPHIVLLAAVSMFPTALLAHVGELYAHTATFWFAMLVALAAHHWFHSARPALQRTVLAVAAVAYLASLGSGLRANLGEMRATGELAALWRERYDATVASLPAGSVVFVRSPWPVRNRGDYSLYRLTSPDFVMTLWTWVRRTEADRRIDVVFEWSEDTDLDALRERARTVPVYELRRTADAFVVTPLPGGASGGPVGVS